MTVNIVSLTGSRIIQKIDLCELSFWIGLTDDTRPTLNLGVLSPQAGISDSRKRRKSVEN